jgi:hypothetical protein
MMDVAMLHLEARNLSILKQVEPTAARTDGS